MVQTFDGLREIRGSHLPFNMSANDLVALLNDGKTPLGAADWHFMTPKEISEHKAAEETETEPRKRGSRKPVELLCRSGSSLRCI
jgi:hypothetical protein